jgi:G6PDH family F420-dependent oxidoreductase
VRTFHESGGAGKPTQAGMKVCWADTEDEGLDTAHRLWANEGLPGQLAQILPRPEDFEAAMSLVPRDTVAESFPCGPDPAKHVEAARAYVDAGFDEVYVQQIGPRQEEFFRFWEKEVLPALR